MAILQIREAAIHVLAVPTQFADELRKVMQQAGRGTAGMPISRPTSFVDSHVELFFSTSSVTSIYKSLEISTFLITHNNRTNEQMLRS